MKTVAELERGDWVRDPVRGLWAEVVGAKASPGVPGHHHVLVRLDGDVKLTSWILKSDMSVVGGR